MARGRHVDRAVIVVGALATDVLGGRIRADAGEEIGEAYAAPRAERAPALDADVARDLRNLRQRVQVGERPGLAVAHHAGQLELVARAVDLAHLFLGVVAVVRERARDAALRKLGRQAL